MFQTQINGAVLRLLIPKSLAKKTLFSNNRNSDNNAAARDAISFISTEKYSTDVCLI